MKLNIRKSFGHKFQHGYRWIEVYVDGVELEYCYKNNRFLDWSDLEYAYLNPPHRIKYLGIFKSQSVKRITLKAFKRFARKHSKYLPEGTEFRLISAYKGVSDVVYKIRRKQK